MTPQPNRFFHFSLIFLLALNLIPHFSDYTVPVLAVGGMCLAWRILYEYQLVPLPNTLTKAGLVLVCVYLVYSNYGQITGLQAGSALLICGVSLKVIDRVGYRDAMVMLFLNFMLLLARFLESQTLGITIFAVFDLIIATALLVQLHNGQRIEFNPLSLLKTGAKLFLQIAPLMVLLFFVFPRFSTNVVGLNKPKRGASGFSETMNPGSVSGIASDDRVAFRVTFKGDAPSPVDRYWRGGVLSTNQGMVWIRGEVENSPSRKDPSPRKADFEYEVLLEPLFNQWLFTLDRPLKVEFASLSTQRLIRESGADVFSLENHGNKKLLYTGYSVQSETEELSERERKLYSLKTSEEDPRVYELVREISAGAKSNEQKALRLMTFYQKSFRYTLTPGPLSTNSLSEFLFEKKVGFCEHFAVSFASLMRLAGVPSRVIVGFQGGRKNDLSNYYLVTSKDAHAWTEIWSDEKSQWLRFDPTTMVSPLRFELGGDIFHSLDEESLLSGLSGDEILSRMKTGFLKRASLAFDAISTNWNLFLLNYDKYGQSQFFARLGFDKVNQVLLFNISLLLLLLFYLWILKRSRRFEKSVSPQQKAWLLLRERLARRGLEKESYEGPRDFLVRVEKEWPEKSQLVKEFRGLYLDCQYGNRPMDKRLKEIAKTI